MSDFAAALAVHRPDWPELPEALERAWQWCEHQGFEIESGDATLLSVTDDDASAVVFDSALSLAGWFEPGAPGYADVLPLVEASGSGTLLALWRDGDHTRVVLLGSDGDRGVLADDPEGLLALLAVGYDEIDGYTLGDEPEEPVDTAAFRDWVQQDLGIVVPGAWPAIEDDAFGAWIDGLRGEPASAPHVVPGDSDGATGLAGVVRALVPLLGRPNDAATAAAWAQAIGMDDPHVTVLDATKQFASHGLEFAATRSGAQTVFIRWHEIPHPEALIDGLAPTSSVDDAIALLGTPERAGNGWVRYVVDGRYVHLSFGEQPMVTLMVEAP